MNNTLTNMMLEAGLNFSIGSWSPREATRVLVEKAPLTLVTIDNHLVIYGNDGKELVTTSSIMDIKAYPNTYICFTTRSGHKYGFVPYYPR